MALLAGSVRRRCASVFLASDFLWGGEGALAPRPKENSKQKRQTRTACAQSPPTAPCLFLKSPFFSLNSLWGGAPRRVATLCLVAVSLSFSTAHAAAMPLPFDALPRRVTPKLAGFIMSQWGAQAALGF